MTPSSHMGQSPRRQCSSKITTPVAQARNGPFMMCVAGTSYTIQCIQVYSGQVGQQSEPLHFS